MAAVQNHTANTYNSWKLGHSGCLYLSQNAIKLLQTAILLHLWLNAKRTEEQRHIMMPDHILEWVHRGGETTILGTMGIGINE